MIENKKCVNVSQISWYYYQVSKTNHTKGSHLLEHTESSQNSTPCRENIEVYDSPYLSDFDALAFLEENPQVKGKEDERDVLLKAEVRHKMAQSNTVALAKSLCAKCPIKDSCLEWVIATETEDTLIYGVAAGYTQKERVQAMRRRAA
ncbi:MAG: WhiB family transcriptional regulator [Enterococcus sp.]|nr:WhiB family transcriptional regulator [Enterococcus sp.]